MILYLYSSLFLIYIRNYSLIYIRNYSLFIFVIFLNLYSYVFYINYLRIQDLYDACKTCKNIVMARLSLAYYVEKYYELEAKFFGG